MYTPQALNSLAAARKRNLSIAVVLKKKKSSHLQPTLMMIFHVHARTQTHTRVHGTHGLVLARHKYGGNMSYGAKAGVQENDC